MINATHQNHHHHFTVTFVASEWAESDGKFNSVIAGWLPLYSLICCCFVLQKSNVKERGMWLRMRKVYQEIYEAEWDYTVVVFRLRGLQTLNIATNE
jgi:hypothetical protein